MNLGAWVLITMMWTNTGSSLTTTYFYTEKACMEARNGVELFSKQIIAKCFYRGD